MSGLARLASFARPRLRPAFVLASLFALASCDSSGPRTGSLSLTVSGLPTGTTAKVTLTGPGFSRVLSGTEVVANLKPGQYTLTPASVLNGLTRYSSITPPQTVTITKSNVPVAASVAYTVSSAILTVTVAGAPAGTAAAVRITGPNSFNDTVTTTTTFEGLEPGSYFIVAPEIIASQQRFTANPGSRQIQLSAGLTPRTVDIQYSQTTGNLRFSVNGLPNGTAAAISVTGPVAPSYDVVGTSELIGVRAGQYTVTAKSIAVATTTFIPNFASRVVTLAAGATADVAVNYSASDGPLNLTIDGVTLTQVVQTFAGSVPLVAGRDAYVRVFARANQSTTSTAQVRVRFYVGATLTHTMTLSNASIPIVPDEASLATSWNGIVSGQFIQPGLRILADVDPTDTVVEASDTDNSFPPSGTPLDVDVRPVPALRVTFVPIVQRFNKLTGNVSDANKEEFLGDARRMLPLLDIDAQLHAPYTTSDSLELTPNDGNSVWLHVLNEMNALRVAESSSRHYFGVVKVSYTSGVAGYGFVPGHAAVGWDYLPSGRNVAAHELTHNFGRFHAPCGGVGGPDPAYPYPGGTIGVYGYDLSTNALRLPSSFDLMGYCSNPWISDYNYVGAMEWRAANASSDAAGAALGLAQNASPRPSLLVWGHMERGRLVLEPAFSLVARPNVPRDTGPYRIEGIARNGRTVFSYSFAGERPADVDDPTARHFAFAIPMDEATQGELVSIRLTGPGAATTAMTASLALGGISAAVNAVEASSTASGRVDVRWGGQTARMALIRDRRTGQVLSFARGGSAQLRAHSTDLEVILSDGVRSVRRQVRVTR